ncbi:MAG TPA: 3'(2'),5'-bisphosphate nucleotidase CysQ [Woeseiaceae bacterium]|nr:3'(2'),5'-bisphosphate nucleotidase CysQ [Woeseiaceae bacterium]
MPMNPAELVEPVVRLAQQAGDAILEIYRTDFAVEHKRDDSPLTKADLAAQRTIAAGLHALTPAVPLISEESGLPPFAERRRWTRYWLVDPLDGTREFVNRNDEFTVNIALIDNHRPLLGVVHVPVLGLTYTGCAGEGATLRRDGGPPQSIHVAARTAVPPRVVGSRSHRGRSLDALLAALGEHVLLPMGSSLKFCRIAEGAADFYPRLGPTSEWDTAAAQAVVEQAGGAVVRLDGEPLLYNTKEDILNEHFLVLGARDRDWVAMAAGAEDPTR